MARTVEQVARKVLDLRHTYQDRDKRMSEVLQVRMGRSQHVAPELFPDAWPKPIVANFIDIAARDLAELIAPLPALNCSSGTMLSDRARKFADKRTKIAHHYAFLSRLQVQMLRGADQYLTYGYCPFLIEPDFTHHAPRIRVEDALMSYPELDRWGKCISFTKVIKKSVGQIIAEYPEYAVAILQHPDQPWAKRNPDQELEIVRYMDDDQLLVYLPDAHNLVLSQVGNLFNRCSVVVAVRPNLDEEMHGQFDDVLWVQLAKARLALLNLEAVDKAVQAPLAVPLDVQELAFGPDAVVRTDSPEKVRRVGMELTPAGVQQAELMEQEQRVGARYPEARSGMPTGSVITGRGIQELMGGFDTQVKAAQLVFTAAFREVFELCFAMDEKFWPSATKTVRGEAQGTPFKLTYNPSKDINGDHTIHVSYGLAAGMDPNRWLVFMLQLRNDELVPREFVQRQMPFDVDVTSMQRQIDVEQTRDALKHSVEALAQAVPQMIAGGADPSHVIHQFATLVTRLQRGDQYEDAAVAAFQAPPQTPETQQPGGPPGSPAGLSGGPMGQQLPPGLTGPPPPGSPAGPIPMPQGAGAPPPLAHLLAGLEGRRAG